MTKILFWRKTNKHPLIDIGNNTGVVLTHNPLPSEKKISITQDDVEDFRMNGKPAFVTNTKVTISENAIIIGKVKKQYFKRLKNFLNEKDNN